MKLRPLLISLTVACSPSVFAASSGSLGSTSSGSTDVSVTVDDLVQVLVEQDVGMGTASAGTNSTGSTGLCVYRNSAASVNLTLTSANASGTTFRMKDSGTNYLPYAVDISGADTVASVGSGTAAALANPDSSSSTCSSSYPHNMNVTVQSTDLDAAPPGAYSDTVTVLVAPI